MNQNNKPSVESKQKKRIFVQTEEPSSKEKSPSKLGTKDVYLGKGWLEWLRSYFKRLGLRGRKEVMAKWGRQHYGITEKDDFKAIRQLCAILKGKESSGAFKPLKVRKGKKIKSQAVKVTLPENVQFVGRKTQKTDFYNSWEWKKARYEALKKYGAKCMCCGATREQGAKICVDHIKPRAFFPTLELDLSNLQVLCDDCNRGKGRWDETDWRSDKS